MDDYKQFAIDFIKRAGDIMRQHFTMGVKKRIKPGEGPVTAADLAINHRLIEEVKKLFPDHGVLGEEESNLQNVASEYVWVCDPIDGTIAFARGIPIATSSLALTKNGKSILGVVYDPFCDRLYFAEKGQGATMNGKPIRVSQTAKLDGADGVVEISRSSKFDVFGLPKLLKVRENANVATFQAIVYSSMLTAAGQFDFNVFPRTGAHDAAAVKIIVEEADGKVTDLFGNEQRYDRETKGFVATNGKVHDELIKVIQEVLKSK